MMTMGEKIKMQRKRKGLTQKQLADKINKGFSTVQKYELDIVTPPLSVVKKIASTLKISVFDLLSEPYYHDEDGSIHSKVPSKEISDLFDKDSNIEYEKIRDESRKQTLLNCYEKLNEQGKEQAYMYIYDLTLIDKYTNVIEKDIEPDKHK